MADIKFGQSFPAMKVDELIGDNYEPLITRNIKFEGEFKRGTLMAAENATATFRPATATDKDKFFVIAAYETADSDVAVAYQSGVFNREKIVDGTENHSIVDGLENELRKQNIFLTSIRKNYDND